MSAPQTIAQLSKLAGLPAYYLRYKLARDSPLSWEDIKPASGFMVGYLYLREYCGMPLSAEEAAAVKQSVDSLGTDEESEYLKSHLQEFV